VYAIARHKSMAPPEIAPSERLVSGAAASARGMAPRWKRPAHAEAHVDGDPCRLCGGDGRIGNTLGGTNARCPGCHGTGRRGEATAGFHDVTKTKPSHHRAAPAPSRGPKVPTTPEGAQLAQAVRASAALSDDAKARLVAEIVQHESTHARCTQTFIKKVRKQVAPSGASS
jgi:hypothetical protein